MTDAKFDINTVLQDAKQVITQPVAFYRAMPQQGGFANPVIFVVVMALISGVVSGLLGLIGFSSLNMGMTGFAALGAIIWFPIGAVIGSFIFAAIFFVIWKLMGSQKNYELAYRCLAYSTAIMPIISVIALIPYVSGIVQTLWFFLLMAIASVQVHALKESSVKIVFGILAAIAVLWGIKSEHTARKYQTLAANYTQQLPDAAKTLEKMQNLSSEEAGEELGKFLKGLEKSMENAEPQKTN